MLEELDYEDEIPAGDNDGECDRRVEKPNIEFKEEKESDSDTGEILDDEEPNDLEEGEIKDIEVSTKKNSESVCRFFQRGACMFGSQCQFLHVSDKVYKLLDTKPVNKNNWNGFPPQPFPPPPQFFHNPAPLPIPDVQNSWERGIQNAKKIMQQGPKRTKDEFDAFEEETDWDRGLAQAKALISNSSSKRKDSDKAEKLIPEKSLTRRQREPSPEKRFYGTNGQKPQYIQESNFKKENFDNGRKPKYDKERSNYHMDWVDPWRRSKSPKGRKRSRSVSRSLSLSPKPRNRLRKRSGSSCSCSSSSSNFKRTIYGSPIISQSKRSGSRSYSISPPTLRGKGNTHSHKQKHRKNSYRKSVQRSSYSRSRSSSCSSGGFDKRRDNRKLSFEKGLVGKKPMVISNSKKPSLPERAYKEKTVHSDDDDGSSSDMTVSSLSGSSLSSISDASSLHNENTVRRDRRSSPPPRNGFGNNQRKTDYSNTNQTYQKYPYKPRKPVDEHSRAERKRVSPSRNGYAPQNRRSSFEGRVHELPSSTLSKAKSHHAISVEKTSQLNPSVDKLATKPSNPVKNSPAKRVKRQVSSAELELLKYHSAAPTSVSKPPKKTIEIKSVPLLPPLTQVVDDCPKVPGPQTRHKITLNLQPKTQKQFKPAENVLQVCNTEKEGASKREQLLQQLKAIEDAIARKKHF